MGKQRFGGIGMIEEGALKGRKYILPSELFVENGEINGQVKYSKACLIHHKFVPDQGCQDCAAEIAEEEKTAKELGL